MTDLEIRNREGERLDHTFHPASREGVLVILGHGLTGNKDRPLLIALAEGLAALGRPCLRLSFSGNGSSEGSFVNSCITKEIADLQSVLDAVPYPTHIAYIGHSMGGAVGVLTAARDARISTLISLAGMTHTADFVKREFANLTPGQDVMWEDEACPLSANFVNDLTFIGDTLSAAEAVTQPWLLIHGAEDDIVPPLDSQDAHVAAAGEKQLLEIPAAGHAFDEASYPQIIAAIDVWLTSSSSV